ncbi:MAG: ATP-binding cassette domain-containing protein [Clostridia bacterium]|nr:ATP-binding cassette domain-containing protein [Clostridia bacterium]
MIEVKNISKAYDGKTILEDISFSVNKGECVALTGASGAGKTTLMRIIAGLEKPDSGEVKINESIRKTYVFQENRLLENKTVLENILAVAPDKNKALYFLERCFLLDDKDKKAGHLSGGMKRRLAIARALSYGGELYFFDEPLRELDGDTLKAVAALIKEEIHGKTALFITHDEFSLDFICDRKIEITNKS